MVAASLAPASYAAMSPQGARLLLSMGALELAEGGADDSQGRDLQRHRREITLLIEGFTERLWGRRDAAAVYAVKQCVVDLPTALLLRPHGDATLSCYVLERAVRGVLGSQPPVQGVDQ